MELIRQTERYLSAAVSRTILQEQTGEAIVPDSSPDVERILGASGQVLLRSKECRAGSVSLSGGVRVTVLYVPEGEHLPRALELYLPFTARLDDPALEPEDQVITEGLVRAADARPINSRKVLVRVNLALRVRACRSAEEEIVCGVPEAEGLQARKTVLPLTVPVCAGEKAFSVTDEAELPAGRTAAQVYQWYAWPELTEARVVGERGVFRGSVNVRALYRSGEDQVEAWNFSAPFSQFADLPGAQEGDELAVTLAMTGAELELGAAPGNRLLYSFGLTAQCVASARKTVTLIEDLYSTRGPLELQCRALTMENRLDRQLQLQTARQSVPADAARVLDAQVLLDEPQIDRDGDMITVTVPAVVSLVYQDAAGGLQGAAKQTQVKQTLRLAQDCTCRASACLSGETVTAAGPEGMEVRFGVLFELLSYSAQAPEGVWSAEQAEDGEPEPRPSVIVRALEEDETLWDVAKACRTTVKAIQEANGLTGEDAPAGRLLLIPRAG